MQPSSETDQRWGQGQFVTCAGIIFHDPSNVVRQGGNTIVGCYIGTNATGTMADRNDIGIQDNSFGSNTIGGTTPADRNVISGNGTGIEIARHATGYSVQNVIQGNYIGLDATGTALVYNTYGIFAGPPYPGFSPGLLIGGSTPGARNVIAGNGNGVQINEGINDVIQGNTFGLDATGLTPFNNAGLITLEDGIILQGETNATIRNNVIVAQTAAIALGQEPVTNIPTHGTMIQGNYIGTDVTGNRVPVPSGGMGVSIASGAANNTIGGSGAGQGNVIGGFNQGIDNMGIASTGNVIQGNKIGISVNGSPIPNATGIAAHGSDGGDVVGGINAGEGNVIAFNTQSGIVVQNGPGNVIRGNSMYSNGALGIDFVFPFSNDPYPNDVGDGDTGPNTLQNFPILTSVTFPDSAHVRIQGTLNSKATTHYTIDFYSNPPPLHPRDFLQGRTWIGLFDNPAITDNQGNLAFDVTLPVSGVPNVWVSMTATDDAGNTSEMSQRSLFSISPNQGPAATAIGVSIKGQLFQPGATVRFGPGLFASSVNVASATQITAMTPALFAGTLYDLTVTNPGASTAVMQKAFMVDFNDVPPGTGLYRFVMSLASDGVTAGCGGGNYCPGNPVTRAQMAVFLILAEHGPWFIPPPATGTIFNDVGSGAFATAFIEQLFHEAVTGGCGGGNYCPGSSVTRAQMAVFLLRTKEGPAYTPPACTTPTFADVPCSSPFARWVDELAARGITAGCGGGNYCPNNAVTRGQMAVFLSTTFSLP